MKKFLSRVFTINGSSETGVSSIFISDLFKFAQKHFSKDFPNSARVGCPPPKLLSEMVRAQQLPDKELRTHLFICSECYAYYHEQLPARPISVRMATASSGVVRPFNLPRMSPVFAVALLLTVATPAFLILWNYRSDPRPETAKNSSGSSGLTIQPSPPVSAEIENRLCENIVAPSTAKSPSKPKQARNVSLAANTVKIDLTAFNSLRGKNELAARTINLKTAVNRLVIKLPDGSPRGAYMVSLADPFGSAIRSVRAHSKNGKTVRFGLDLSEIKPGSYLVCVAAEKEMPDCAPATAAR
jgi:hypothetical protein